MFVEFDTLQESSRVWIYQANREFKQSEFDNISIILHKFVSNWKRHGENLRASFKLKYNKFIILAVDESYNDVSGCSIDSSVQIIREIQNEFNIDLLNKMIVSFKDGENINTVSLKEFKEFARMHKIDNNTVVFNNLINSKAEFENDWEITAGKSWHKKFIE
jgi:hypothetical protein